MLKLFYSAASPYVRKVMVCAHELGLTDQIEKLSAKASPVERDEKLGAVNPMAKVPSAVTEDGTNLYDSRVICEYLDSLSQQAEIFPAPAERRWKALTQQALGDGLLDAAILVRYETLLRPAEFRWSDWEDGQRQKILAAVDQIEKICSARLDGFDIGAITMACALGYLDFRFADQIDWRADHSQAAAWFEDVRKRPSMEQTQPS